MKLIHAALLTLTVTGCASTPIPVSEATSVPAERYYWTEKTKTSNPGKLIIIRDSGLAGAAGSVDVLIDDKPLAALKVGEKAEVSLDSNSNDYLIQVDVGGPFEREIAVDQMVRSGQVYHYRIYFDGSGYVHLVRIKKID